MKIEVRNDVPEIMVRLPIRPMETIDLPQMFTSRKINARLIARIQHDFPRRIDATLRRALSTAR